MTELEARELGEVLGLVQQPNGIRTWTQIRWHEADDHIHVDCWLDSATGDAIEHDWAHKVITFAQIPEVAA